MTSESDPTPTVKPTDELLAELADPGNIAPTTEVLRGQLVGERAVEGFDANGNRLKTPLGQYNGGQFAFLERPRPHDDK